MKNKKGFTLIELLVVVLIIGILAAIALPQYQKSIEKSKATQALTLIKTIDGSIKSYNLATGHYPTSFDQLDISIPESFDKNENDVNNSITYGKSGTDWNISIERVSDESAVSLRMMRVKGRYKGAGFRIGYGSSEYGLLCMERKTAARFIFDSNLPAGAYCEKIMHGSLTAESQFSRYYTFQ